jgi:tRNA nucleotidyltransferase (CCA-adding enzyme)
MTGPGPALGFETFPHGADIGVRGWGPTCEAAFEQVALAMTSCIVEPRSVRQTQSVAIECHAPDREILLLDWLNALVFEMATRRLLFSRFTVGIRGSHLTGQAFGEPVDRERHAPAIEVKGATCTELRVSYDGALWRAQCVVDV